MSQSQGSDDERQASLCPSGPDVLTITVSEAPQPETAMLTESDLASDPNESALATRGRSHRSASQSSAHGATDATRKKRRLSVASFNDGSDDDAGKDGQPKSPVLRPARPRSRSNSFRGGLSVSSTTRPSTSTGQTSMGDDTKGDQLGSGFDLKAKFVSAGEYQEPQRPAGVIKRDALNQDTSESAEAE